LVPGVRGKVVLYDWPGRRHHYLLYLLGRYFSIR
jgi:hypothetical protein